MSAKPYCKKTAAVIGWFIQNFPTDVDDGWVGNAEATKEFFAPLAKPPFKKKEPILHLLSAGTTILVDACDGSETLAQAKDVFKSGIDADFTNWSLDQPSVATPAMATAVYEMRRDANFVQMFGSLGSDLDKLCMTQHQIKVFCKKNKKWLRKGGFATFFLFKSNGHFFVAYVGVRGDGLLVCVHRFERGYVWHAEDLPRVVVPQMIA